MKPTRRAALAMLGAFPIAACAEDPNAPWFRIAGGGFVFNYREAFAFAGVAVRTLRRLEPGMRFEAAFDDPARGAPILVVAEVIDGALPGYALETGPLQGVERDRDYRVHVRLLAADGRELQAAEFVLRSTLDQAILPKKPLTIGPGYTPNPDR